MDYLRQVVVEDSLGIGAELEKDMQALVASYHCEWHEAIHNEKMMAKFSHFANTEDHDPTQAFVPLRDMKKPADWENIEK